MKKNIFIALAVFSSFFTVLNAYSENNKLTLALSRNTVTSAEETFTYAIPKQLGYFSDEKLDTKILQTDGSTAALQAVASGSADIGYASSLNIAAAVDKGVPLKAFAGVTVRWPYFIGVPKGSGIKTIGDLKGKRVGVISLASASYADLRANLKLAGLKETDVTIIPIGAGARAASAITANQIDAVDSYSDSFTLMRQNGVELDILKRPPEMEKLFSVTMVTSNKALKEKPEQLAAFARAAYKGIIYTQLYPESALKLAFREFPQLAGSGNINSQDAKNTAESMRIALEDSIPVNQPDPERWGEWLNISVDRWEALLTFAHDTSSTDKKLNVDQIWDASLMPKIYSFQIKSIVEK